MGEIARDFAKKYVADICDDLAKAEKTIAELKKPFGTFTEYAPLVTRSRYYDIKSTADWLKYEKDIAADKETVQENARLYLQNEALLQRLVDTIQATGCAKESYTWKRNKRHAVTCDWVTILRGSAPSGYISPDQLARSESEKRAEREKYLESIKSAEQERERLQQEDLRREIRHREEAVAVVKACEILGLDPTKETPLSILSECRKRDKYADLSLGGQQTRGDWNDGPWAAREALGRFEVTTDTDQYIVDDWQSELDSFDDGRQFRDCQFSYDRVMGMASEEVQKAIGLVMEFVPLGEYGDA